MNSHKPVIIILSAARSGSKLFRDVLSQHPQIASIPYDINYIWKYKNYNSHDELTPLDVTEDISAFIKNYIINYSCQEPARFIVEKTVSNTLRVEFVRSIFPQAKIIHLFRDGRDVALSARNCWNASSVSSKNQPKSILIKKISDYPYVETYPYILKKLSEKLKYNFRIDKRVPIWGPEFKTLKPFMNEHNLLQVCAKQWSVCVSKTLFDLKKLIADLDYVSISYEDFVSYPEKSLSRLTQFLGIRDITPMLHYAQTNVDPNYIGKWKDGLNPEERACISPIVNNALTKLGYAIE